PDRLRAGGARVACGAADAPARRCAPPPLSPRARLRAPRTLARGSRRHDVCGGRGASSPLRARRADLREPVRRRLPRVPSAGSPPPAPPPAPAPDPLFVGHFGHPPNGDAVGFLVYDVLPRLGRPVGVRVVGRGPVPPLPAEIDVAGAVPDVRPHLAAARVVVAPVRFGTGMRGKVLEALAMGRPVVTTSVGAEGLGAVSGRDVLVADGADGFAGAVRRVLDDPGLGVRLGAAGRALVAARFDWDAIAAAHED